MTSRHIQVERRNAASTNLNLAMPQARWYAKIAADQEHPEIRRDPVGTVITHLHVGSG
jgi:hypothetical protein